MIDSRDVQRQKEQNDLRFEPNHNTPWGVIVEVEGSTTPPNRINMTWVDMYNRSGGRLAVINETTLKAAGTPVRLGPSPKPPYLEVVGTYNESLDPVDTTINLGQFNTPPHGPNHQIPTEGDPGSDPTLIYQPAVQMLKGTGNGTDLTISIQPLIYWLEGTRKEFPGFDLDVTSYVPATAGQTRKILVYLDKGTNLIGVVEGTAVSGAIPVPYPIPPSNVEPSAYVSLSNGQTAVTTATHIEDARGFLGSNAPAFPFVATEDGEILIVQNGVFVVARPMVDNYGIILIDDNGNIMTW